MSFITKRERVFNEYDLFDLPPRNEGKLKAYASCTDARAWSHFCADKTEHLVEIIKRNNDTCRPKYVPTDVIVQTLMVAKNAEITKLKRKIEEFEQMLATYDQLELTCEQKCDIAKAHAAIKAANKELDDYGLDLDLSGFTEGMESDAFETGKSRGDEPSHNRYDEAMSKGSESVKSRGDEWNFEKESPKTDTKSNQTGLVCSCDMSTNAEDPRIPEMQETIISKDAKLSAMQNTIAVMENDVCEPYCIYAHIYTALEKIFGVLCQNDKYKLYLNLMTAGKDTRCIDIRGKILYKLKVLEKFSLALIAPCSQEDGSNSSDDCACFRAEVIARIDFPQPSSELKKPSLDNKRAQMVADIMENEEMKEILSKDSSMNNNEEDQTDDDKDNYSIDTENLKRLKNLQKNYEELITCYEKVKYDKECLQVRYNRYQDLEKEYENLKSQLIEYNALWNEKEHYRKRSLDIDSLREQYLVLADETSNLETRLKAESEINLIKSNTIEELRTENIELEKKLNEAQIIFEKEKNGIECKLKETECTVMCREQEIKSLSVQIDRLLEQGHEKINEESTQYLMLIDEIESLKEQIKNLKDTLYCNEEEKQNLEDAFQDKLRIINELGMEIEHWKSLYEKASQRNDYLEKYTDNFREEVLKLIEENKELSQDVREKSDAVENLRKVINSRSLEVETLRNEIDKKDDEKINLGTKLQDVQELYNQNITKMENEKEKALRFLHLAKQESQELLNNTNKCSSSPATTETSTTHKIDYTEDYLKFNTTDQRPYLTTRRSLQSANHENDKCELLEEIQKLREVNSHAIHNVDSIKEERDEYKASLELTKKESVKMEHKLLEFEYALKEMEVLKEAHHNLIKEKCKLENDLKFKNSELELALQSTQLSKKESEELLSKLEHFKVLEDELIKLNDAYRNVLNEKQDLQEELREKNKELKKLLDSINNQNNDLIKAAQKLSNMEKELSDKNIVNENLITAKNELQKLLTIKSLEIKKLGSELESNIKENHDLVEEIKSFEVNQKLAYENIVSLKNANLIAKTTLDNIKKESAALIDKLKQFETLQSKYEKLKIENESMKTELNQITAAVKEISTDKQNLQSRNEDLEKTLIVTRNQLVLKQESQKNTYEGIFKELENMKEEKIQNHNKIKDLIYKLDESNNIVSSLNEDLIDRNNKIAILENHINKLDDEIRNLHENLDTAIETGEQISINSFEKYDSSLKGLEAHHSRAAHNIKLELANLQKEHTKLEKQLSITKSKSEETSRNKNKYLSQVMHLENERKNIINGIQQLEKKCMCDSALSLDQCAVEDILDSLNRISKSIDAKKTTILNVQSSSQLLLSKADEAKKLVEKEKQKIIMEKEEAIREKLQMENRFSELKKTLENKISRDAISIKDLEANFLNQKLIAENSISQLKKELQNLQSHYKNSISEVKILQEKICKLSVENSNYLETNDRLKENVKQRIEIASLLQQELDNIKNKTSNELGIQVLPTNITNISCQTDNLSKTNKTNDDSQYVKKDDTNIPNLSVLQSDQALGNTVVSHLLPKLNQHSFNEVQILTANVEPTFDFVKSSYWNYKIQRLSPGKLEQYSISSEETSPQNSETHNHNLDVEMDSSIMSNDSKHNLDVEMGSSIMANDSLYSNLPQANDNNANIHSSLKQVSATKIVAYELSEINAKSRRNKGKKDQRETLIKHPKREAIKEDLFVIYKDGEIDQDKVSYEELKIKPDQSMSKEKGSNKIQMQHQKTNVINRSNAYFEEEEADMIDEDDSVKPKLKINLPRVDNDNYSTLTISDVDRKSLDSSIIGVSAKTNSLTNVKLYSNLEMRKIKHQTPTIPTLSNVDNIDLSDTVMLDTDDDGSRVFQYVDKIPNLYTNDFRHSEQYDKQFQRLRHQTNQDQNLSDEIKLSSRIKELNDKHDDTDISQHNLSRVNAEAYLIKPEKNNLELRGPKKQKSRNFALDYILDTVRREVDPGNTNIFSINPRKIKSDERLHSPNREFSETVPSKQNLLVSSLEYRTVSSPIRCDSKIIDKSLIERSFISTVDDINDYKNKIKFLTKSLELTEKDYKKKLEAIKSQYDRNIKNIINEHNQGVKNIQGLHEETLQDVIRSHENEVENLRTMSIEANRKAERLEKENRALLNKIKDSSTTLDEEPMKMSSDLKRRRKSLIDSKMLTKTNVVACNVKPKVRTHGPCSCSLDVNISDTIRNIFEQVDVDQRKMAEYTYIKYIANKILSGNVEALDGQELSFLHLKVCRTWKMKLSKEEALQKRIDNLESELISRQRHAQQHIAELDRKVEEEKRRLQEVREKVGRCSPIGSRTASPESGEYIPSASPPTPAEKDTVCSCRTGYCGIGLSERRSAGDLVTGMSAAAGLRPKRLRMESNRAVSAKLNVEREKKLYNDEPPTRLRRSYDRQGATRLHKK